MLKERLIGMYANYENDEELKGLVIEFREGGFINQDIADLVDIKKYRLAIFVKKWELSYKHTVSGNFSNQYDLIDKLLEYRKENKLTNIEIAKLTGITKRQLEGLVARLNLPNKLTKIAGELTQEILKSILHYDEDTGIFTWLESRGSTIKCGDIAGGDDSYGYIVIGLFSQQYRAHRLAYLYMTGKSPDSSLVVDHKDHVRHNNIWSNLRLITKIENERNQSLNKKNKSGQVGVYYDNRDNLWCVCIKNPVNGKRYTASFTKELKNEAIEHAKQKYKEFGYHENHGKPLEQPYDTTKRSKLIKEQTPKNMDKNLMKLILDNTPEGYHDDHIIPLSKDGLHEPSNIQYITKEENLKKGNKLDYICKSAINPIEYLKDIQIIV